MCCLLSLFRKSLEPVHLQSTDSVFVGLFVAIQQEIIPITDFPISVPGIKEDYILTCGSFQKISGGLETLFTGLCFTSLCFLVARDLIHTSSLEKIRNFSTGYSPQLHDANMTQQKGVGEVLPVPFTVTLAVIRGTQWLHSLTLWTPRPWVGH